MTKLNAFIVEDEKHNRDLLHDLLKELFHEKINVTGSSGSVLESAELLKQNPADILFLDIELSDGQVFDLLNHIDHKKYKLIFITGYAEHAIKAIRFSAIDYLLKPIISSELVVAVNKVIATEQKDNPELDDLIHRRQFDIPDYLIINSLHEIEKIPIAHISYLEADGIYTNIYHNNKKTISSKPLGMYEDILPAQQFHRCHKSFIVNRNFITQIHKGRSLLITLSNQSKIPVSIRKKEEFSRWLRK